MTCCLDHGFKNVVVAFVYHWARSEQSPTNPLARAHTAAKRLKSLPCGRHLTTCYASGHVTQDLAKSRTLETRSLLGDNFWW